LRSADYSGRAACSPSIGTALGRTTSCAPPVSSATAIHPVFAGLRRVLAQAIGKTHSVPMGGLEPRKFGAGLVPHRTRWRPKTKNSAAWSFFSAEKGKNSHRAWLDYGGRHKALRSIKEFSAASLKKLAYI
jgi:hypothetical protein